MGADTLLGTRATEEDVVENDPRARMCHGGDAGHPGRLDRAERVAHDDLASLTEVDPATGGRQRIDEIVDSEPDPRLRENSLQAAGDARLAGARAAVEDDHLRRHGACDRSRSDPRSPTGPRCLSLSGLTIELMPLI